MIHSLSSTTNMALGTLFAFACLAWVAVVQGKGLPGYDNNGCPAGHNTYMVVYGNRCYELAPNRVVLFQDAYDFCDTNGGTLAVAQSQEQNNVLVNMMNQYSVVKNAWIGLTDRKIEGTYYWSDGSSLVYSNFQFSKQPNQQSNLDCVVLNKYTQKWDTKDCDMDLFGIGDFKCPFFCEYRNRKANLCPDQSWCQLPCFNTGYRYDSRGCKLCQCN